MWVTRECALVMADDMQQASVPESGMRESTPARVHVGRPARRALMAGRGSVLAAFESALYLEGAGGIACLLPRSAPRGPLNVVVDGFRPGTPQLHGTAWRIHGTALAIDGFGTFAVSLRDQWTPPRLPAASPTALLAGLASIRTALAARAPRGDLIVHTLGRRPEQPAVGASRPVSRTSAFDLHFARKLPALARWLGDALRGRGGTSPCPIFELLGAGRGLTPSGDDCIVGLLVALHALGERDIAATVACIVARHAPRRTNRLSAAHLDAACAGEAIEPLHTAIAALAADTSPEPALDALERFGHGSGFDALAGVLLAADAIAHNREFAPCFRRSSPGGTDGIRTPARRP